MRYLVAHQNTHLRQKIIIYLINFSLWKQYQYQLKQISMTNILKLVKVELETILHIFISFVYKINEIF